MERGEPELRLGVPVGVTVLQDVMYAQNMRLLVDLGLCLRTVPAALFGGGGG